MKILFCSDALTIDGVTSYILNVGAALSRSGHEIAVLGRWAGKGFQMRYREEGFRVITCPSLSVGNTYFDVKAKHFNPDVIMTDPRRSFPLATRIKKLTNAPVITYFLDPVEKTDRPGRDLASLVKFSDVFTAFEPGILAQLHELNVNALATKMTRALDEAEPEDFTQHARNKNVPVTKTTRAPDEAAEPEDFTQHAFNKNVPVTKTTRAPDEAAEPSLLTQHHEPNFSVPIIKMTRPLDVFFAPSELPGKKDFSILCFGRLSRYKTPGIFHMLDNIELIQAHIPDFRINILGGGGWRLYKLKLFAHELNKKLGRKCVRIIGAQDNPRSYIEEANVIFASATSAMEAAYSLRPVIAMCSSYFGQVTPENLDEAIKSYFSERYGKSDFAGLLPDLFKIYDEYESEIFRENLRVVSSRLGCEFAAKETVKSFNEIIKSGIQWHPGNSA